jgi:hypothetical protein
MNAVPQALNSFVDVTQFLGTSVDINAPNSKDFADQIYEYVATSTKTIVKEETPPPTILDAENAQTADKESAKLAPSLWPLIRQVRIKCRSKALSSGAVIVDLPGVGDANAARNAVAKEYMKKCGCVWIVASIQRYMSLYIDA